MRIHADHQPYRKKPHVARWYEAAPSSAKAADGNPGKTALIVSHRDQDCLYRHYLGIANRKDAEKYFEIRPLK